MGEFIRARLTQRRKEGETHDEIARSLHVSKTHVINVVNHGRGMGGKVEEGFSRLYYAGKVDAMRADAAEWFHANHTPPAPPMANTELAKAIEFLRGKLPDAFLDDWIGANSDKGWEGVDREGFRLMLEAAYVQSAHGGGYSRALEKARAKKLSSKTKVKP